MHRNSRTSDRRGPPCSQAALVCSAFLRHSRDFYDYYEDIQEQIERQHRDPDKAVLFESMAFFLFILDFDLFHSEQTDKTNDYVFLLCERLVVHPYTGHKGVRFGSPQQIHDSIQHRLRAYAEFLRGLERQDPVAFFVGCHNPVVSNMQAARGADSIRAQDFPIVIGDGFAELGSAAALTVAYKATVCPFHFGLQELFRGNEDFLGLPEEEVRHRLSRGASRARQLLDERG